MAGEHVILLDEQDKPTGMLEKYAAHTLNTPLHLAFSSWLFNEQGQRLIRPTAGHAPLAGQKSLARRMDELSLRASANRRNL